MAKYNNKKVTIDNIKFDSKGEANRYLELKLMQRAGEINSLELQPKFTLIPTFRKNGKTFHSVTYKADFKYIDKDGSIVIEDFKGFETKDFIIKRKLFEYLNPELELKITK